MNLRVKKVLENCLGADEGEREEGLGVMVAVPLARGWRGAEGEGIQA